MLHAKSVTQNAVSRTAARLALSAALIAGPAAWAQEGTTTPVPVATPHVTSRAKLEPGQAASYDNKYEVYGGLSFMNGQAGQNLPKRYDMGGGEVMFTYWLGRHLGVAGDYRIELGTTPLLPTPYYNRVLVTQNIASGGVQWRGPKNRYAAVDYHALAGATKGVFDHAILNYPGGSPVTAQAVGLYPNTTSPFGAVGGSIDFNYKPNIAIRLQPDMIFEHFGTELREFVSVSGGVVYRFGHR
jgi:hypothetical protein